MTNDGILEGIDSYCADKESDYAIMITGPWGSGKTYYANNKINSFLAKKGKKTAYVSLFGVTKNEEIDRLVIQAVYPFVKSSIFKLGSAVAQTALKTAASLHQIDLVLPQLSMPVRDIVIIFDDLERASKLIDTSELIGYIDRYCSQRYVKCIIVCNEEEIDKSEYSTSDPGETVYRIAKEKTVRYTYKYDFDLDQILAYLSDISCDEAEKTASRVIVAERNTLSILPKDYEVNARVLITAYHLVVRLVAKSEHLRAENHYGDFIENATRCILAYLVEHKTHQVNMKEITETIKAQETLAFELSSTMQHNHEMGEEDGQNTGTCDIRNIYTRIREWFFPFRQAIYLSGIAAQLTHHGVAFEKDINEEFRDFVGEAFPELDSVKILFSPNYSLLDDDGFSAALDESLRQFQKDDISLSEIVRMVSFFEYFLKEGLTSAYSEQDLLTCAKQATDRILEVQTISNNDNELTLISTLYPKFDGVAKQVFEYVQLNAPLIDEVRLKQRAQDDWKELYTSPDVKTLYQTFGLQSEWNLNVFFGYLETDDVLSGIDTMSNSVKRALAEVISNRYTKAAYQQALFEKEKDRLDNVRNLLRAEIESDSVRKPLSFLMKKRIVAAIDGAFEKYAM
jgi:hypothetical protein